MELGGIDITSLSLESATSSESQFDLGACVVGKCEIGLQNHDGHLDKLDFTDATVVPYVGKAVSSGIEWLRMGTYVTDDPGTRSGIVTLECLDALSKLSRPFSDVGVTYPAKPSEIAEAIFAKCGLTVQWDASPIYDERVSGAQDNDISCQQAMAYLAQVMGVWVRADEYGVARMGWYDTSKFETGVAWYQVGRQWSDRDVGRSTWSYTVPIMAEGETYASKATHVTAPYSLSASTDDVVITGVSVTAQNEVKKDSEGNETNGADGETAMAGEAGYVLSCTGNPFVEYGRATAVAQALYARVGGLKFRPLTVSMPTDPSIEAGDPLICVDRRGNWYQCYATSVTIAVDAASTVRCSARSAARNSAQGASAATQAVVQARHELRRERTARELATRDMNARLSEARGLYDTEETLADGSTIYYLHDKPTIAASQIIWKMNANAVSVSRDGGKTYATGVTADGDAILNRIYAIGIDADHITSGKLSSHDGRNYFDLDTGEASFTAGTKVGGDTVLSSVDVLYGTSDSPDVQPREWQSDPPAWVDGTYIWSKTRTKKGGVESDTEPVCITGARGATGEKGDDGSSVSIKGTAPTTADLPSDADQGDGWLVAGDLWVWYGSSWTDVGRIQGPAGKDGASVTVSSVAYAVGNSGTAAPETGWQKAVPDVPQGSWLWCKVTYSDGTEANTCSREGTDGADGQSVAVRSVTKTGKVTTVVLDGPDGATSSLSIEDGQDGATGQRGDPGPDGRPSYTHIAWADSIGGEPADWWQMGGAWSEVANSWADTQSGYVGFSTTESEGKSYVGVYSDDAEADSDDPDDYSWSLIKGRPGTDGNSVAVRSAEKSDGVTTVVITDTDGNTQTLSIEDGKDGDQGIRGRDSYTHIAWADSLAGTSMTWGDSQGDWSSQSATWASSIQATWGGFTTSGGEGKAYIGVYEDDVEADSQDPSAYTWSLVKGKTGTGVSEIVEQYYSSTSPMLLSGSSWQSRQQEWVPGRYVWTRSQVTWNDGRVTYTDPVLADAINSANENAASAKHEVDSLDQEEIFNRLTNGGQTQGIYLLDGRVYINGSYIKSGTVDAGLLKAGTIKSKSGGSYWDLDTGKAVFELASGTTVDGYSTTSQLASVASDASNAKATTDHIHIDTNGMTVTGSNGQKIFSTTYGSDGTRSFDNMTGMKSAKAELGVKDWGIYYGNQNSDTKKGDNNTMFWVTEGKQGSKYPESPADKPSMYFGVPGCSILLNGSDGFRVTVGTSYIELHPNSDFIVKSGDMYLKLNGTSLTNSAGDGFSVRVGDNTSFRMDSGFNFQASGHGAYFTNKGWNEDPK